MWKVGDLCFIGIADPTVMNFYRNHQKKNPFLVCPCKVHRDQVLVVDQILTSKIVLLHYEDKPTRLTVGSVDKLVKVKKDD